MNFSNPMSYKVRFSSLFVRLSLVLMLMAVAQLLSAQQVTNYAQAMEKAETLMKKHQLLDAKAYFQMALRYKVGDAKATKKIKEIIDQLKASEGDEEKYYNIIDRADAFLDNDRLDEALQVYQNALRIIPNDDYAKNKIAEIRVRLAREKAKQQAYKMALQKGDALMKQQKFQQAIDRYRQAEHLYPKNPLATGKIAKANEKRKVLLEKKKFAAKQVELAAPFLKIEAYDKALKYYLRADSALPGQPVLMEKLKIIEPKAKRLLAYNQVEAAADRLYVARNYLAARLKYEEAKKLWPSNDDPDEMIRKIDIRMAEQRKNLEANYQIAISQADSLMARNELNNAKAQYQMALNLKRDAAYPQGQIKKIDGLLQRALKERQKEYAQIIKGADQSFSKKDYLASRDAFKKALKLLPDAEYPQKRLKQIDSILEQQAARDRQNAQYQSLLAEADRHTSAGRYDMAIEKYREAQDIKKNEKYPAKKIAAVQLLIEKAKQQKALDEKYQQQLAMASDMQLNGKLAEARQLYAKALKMKPAENFPARQIQMIDSLIAQKAAEAKLDADYARALAQGQGYFGKKAFHEALKAFKRAASLKPDEALPAKRIEAVEKELVAIAKAKKLQQAYDEKIAEADSLFQAEQYELSRGTFEKALALKPEAALPKQKIEEIRQILVRLEKEKDQRYALALNKADNLFNSRRFSEALPAYLLAQSIKPKEAYPAQQIEKCNQELALALQQQKAAYAQAISDADKLYAAKIFDKAIHAYQRASKAMPSESYPEQMIAKITKFIADNAVTDVLNEKLTLEAGKEKKFAFDPVRIDVRKKNYVLVRAKNVSGKAFRMIFTYGQEQSKNGGFVVSVPEGVATHDFIIRIGNQYKWFSQDNNWFGVYPENQAVELSLIRISKTQ
jgi:tetratricopeptide (TPR) repeat protein